MFLRIGNNWCCERAFDPIRCDVNTVLEFLTELIHSGLENNTNCNYRSAVSSHFEAIHPFVVEKYSRVSDAMTRIFNNRLPQPRYFLDTLDSNEIKLKLLTYKLTMLLALILLLDLTVSTSPRSQKQQRKVK